MTAIAERRWPDAFRHASLAAGGGVVLLVALMALLAPLVAPHDPFLQNLDHRLIPPVWEAEGRWAHPLGTDALGRDYLSRLIHGARISLLIALAVGLLSGLIGTGLGLAAGYYGGWVDTAVLFVLTNRLAMPGVLITLAVVAIVGGSLTVVILVLGFLNWDRFAVVVRSAAQREANRDYVLAASAHGSSALRIMLAEILPNLVGPLLVVLTVEMAHAILIEAALSFLGLGVPPPNPSWGLMVNEAKDHIFFHPWMIFIPGIAIFTLVLAINLVGDGLRDVLAPEWRP
ncbi:MAG: ABC transporter permease [Alphaproteobacteria bacterium]|nr:ABC transporter permease [Alphaproteobacteria bacterium]